MHILNSILKPFVLHKAKKINIECGDFLGKKVLDLGAGRCYIAKEIKKNNIDVTCIDIDDLNETDLDLKIYDGKSIPYPDKSFDTVLIVYVLHHCSNIPQILKECARVARKNIIIFEDFGNPVFLYPMDYIFNKIHNVDAPLNFKSEGEWLSLFKKLNLKIKLVKRGVEKEIFYPFVKHTMFVLEVGK